ncbi:hypothetical protein B0T24DRAFT_680528 [Lasiosphaeria ovina]|uniref:Uncharacterized protein n=1 Tax=Lasiosphaeria ovina TaxID=92902 RepID=A0AAE0N5X3_9PEZI|nr:hypothetical protein B0T24DRAFT_680528 [Lasiosphaeria ovina]
MSGSGGFYKYRCKYFLSNNCQNWVWVNYAACATCLAEGREGEELTKPGEQVDNAAPQPWRRSPDILVPRAHNGSLQYDSFEIVGHGESGNDWTLRLKGGPQQVLTTTTMTTHDTPQGIMAPTGVFNYSGYYA